VRIVVNAHGTIVDVSTEAQAVPPGPSTPEPRGVVLDGPVVPGVANLHSHAFQRAMAGLAEASVVEGGDDSFWSWRDVMYRFLGALTPDDVQTIATQLYVEMLEAGFTSVGEFHYLHNAPDGTPYADPAEMSLRILAAARSTGIGLTHLPVLYMDGGFGGQAAGPAQRRFLLDPDAALDLFMRVSAESHARSRERVGFAFHSLRAVPPDAMSHCVDVLGTGPGAPRMHIHAAEQTAEVEGCIAWSGARPVEWLLDNQPLGHNWCLVHATHMSGDEASALARAGSVAGLCPTTEANLGDGLFSLADFMTHGGRLGIGSDSHISVSPVEELRWLEYGQRLRSRRRNVAGAVDGGSTAAALFRRAVAGGAQALGQPIGAIGPGLRADLVVLDGEHPLLAGRAGHELLDSWVFSGDRRLVRQVFVGGELLVDGGRHRHRDAAASAFRAFATR
jgi:formimidoylglutamate deiminase